MYEGTINDTYDAGNRLKYWKVVATGWLPTDHRRDKVGPGRYDPAGAGND